MIQWKEIEVAIEAETIPTIMHRGKPIPVFLKTTDPVPTIGLFDGLRNSKEIKYDVVRGAWDFCIAKPKSTELQKTYEGMWSAGHGRCKLTLIPCSFVEALQKHGDDFDDGIFLRYKSLCKSMLSVAQFRQIRKQSRYVHANPT